MKLNIQRLGSKKDLDLLIRGDALEVESSAPINNCAFHEINDMGHFEFLYPAIMRDEYIIMNRVRRSLIQVVDGKIVYDRCTIESFSQGNPKYGELNKTLQMAGLR